jgi:hypothetical protein
MIIITIVIIMIIITIIIMIIITILIIVIVKVLLCQHCFTILAPRLCVNKSQETSFS